MFTFIHIAQIMVDMVGAYFTVRIIINLISCTAAYMKDDINVVRYSKLIKTALQEDTVIIIIIWTIFIQLL